MKHKVTLAAICGMTLVIGAVGWKLLRDRKTEPTDAGTEVAYLSAEVAAPEAAASSDTQLVTLSDEQLQAAAVRVEEVTRHQLQPMHTVPARLLYNDQRHVEIRVATGGILATVAVRPGDQVYAGQVLAELQSAEVGHARADVLQRAADLRLALQRRDWEQTVSRAVEQLDQMIRSRSSLDEIRQQFRTVSLGSSREKILTAYSQLLLAESLTQAAIQNTASGVTSRRVLQERESERNSAEASLQGTLEQLLFDAAQACRQAENAVDDAQRRLQISRQSIATLLGETVFEVNTDTLEGDSTEQLSLVQVRAPFAGTIEQRRFAVSERVAPGDAVFVLADTTTLWVSADLRDRDRGALSLSVGDQVEVFLAASDADPVHAEICIVGREVDPATNAVPLIATIANADGRLRPGMYVRVRVPVGEKSEVLAVPEAALAEHDAQRFLFVAQDEHTFRRVDVTIGQRSKNLVEVMSGISAGDRVVVAGTFGLKSELLLEGEEP